MLTELTGGDLVCRGTQLDAGRADTASAFPRVDPTQPHGRGSRMVTVAVAEGVGLPVREATDDEQLVSERL